MDRNVKAREDLKAKGNAIREPETLCEQCGKKVEDKLIKEKLGGQEKNFCSKDCVNLFKTNLEAQRVTTSERIDSEIHFLERENEYKSNQLKKGVTETRAINQVPGQPAMILDGYVNGLKPDYIIENEIDKNKQIIKEHNRQQENIKQARKEDAASSS